MKPQSAEHGLIKLIFPCIYVTLGAAAFTSGLAVAQDVGLGKSPATGLQNSQHMGLPGGSGIFAVPGLAASSSKGTGSRSGMGLPNFGHANAAYPNATPGTFQSSQFGSAGSHAPESGHQKPNRFTSKLRKKAATAAAAATAPSTPSKYDYSYGAEQTGTDSKSVYGVRWKSPEDGYQWGARPDR